MKLSLYSLLTIALPPTGIEPTLTLSDIEC
jgi:hypothetical protein